MPSSWRSAPPPAGVPKGTLAENVARVEAKEKIAAEAKAKAEVSRLSSQSGTRANVHLL